MPRIGSQDARGSKVVALGAGRDVAGADDGEKEETSQPCQGDKKRGSLPSGLCSIYIWWFPEIGVSPNHPFIDVFSINHPAIGVPHFRKPPYMYTPII